MQKPLVSITDLKVAIGTKDIITGLSLEINPGEFHVLLGPNGSGKSTLASVLAGHPGYTITSAADSLQYESSSLLEIGADQRAQLGIFMAFQQPVEVPGVKVLNFLWEAYKTRYPDAGERQWRTIVQFKQQLEQIADQLAIKRELLFRGLNEGFSGGEKKRLEIVQMMMLAPKLAVLDEIDSGLDVDALKLVAAGITQVRKHYHTAVILITHHQRIVRYFKPDRVHVMMQGKIVKSGSAQLVKQIERMGYQPVSQEQ